MSSTAEKGRPRTVWSVRPGSVRARGLNQRIRAEIRSDTRGELPFFCECGMDHSDASVWITLQEARDVIERGSPILGEHFFQELAAQRSRSKA